MINVEMILAAPILPGKEEAWRRFCQEMRGSRRRQYEESRRALGIVREEARLVPTPQGSMAVINIAAPDLAEALRRLATSQRPFDCWFRHNVLEIHGLDLTQPLYRPWGGEGFHWEASDAR